MAGDNTITFGDTQEIHVGKWRSDRRGLLSGSIQRKIKEPYDKVDLKILNVNAAPPMPIPCVGVEREYVHPHGIYTYSYEGIDGDIDDERLTTFELDITMEEVSIEAHPNIEAIEKKYGTFDTKLRRFPKFLSASSGEDLDAADAANAKQRNPLYGTDSYLSFGATFKKSYVRQFIPASALRHIGAIVKRPPGLAAFPLPAAAKGRAWLKVAPKITRRGNCVHIEENFMMSGRHGIVREIYGESQLEKP
ncbi:MAG: hypothetical protein WCF18_09595 [Chthoniobacteraceae bacterium]